jgi:CheY-like chemotaxis protein
MVVTALRKRSQANRDAEDRKLIQSVLDIINPPNQQAGSQTNSTEGSHKDKSPEARPKIVLHIDDDAEDRDFVNEAIRSIDPTVIVLEAESGQHGIEFLNQAKSLNVLPCLIILDINMPGMNGFDAYNEIKKDDVLKLIPTVIFTTAAVFKKNQNQGNEHLPIFVKPDNMKDFNAAIKEILTHCCP